MRHKTTTRDRLMTEHDLLPDRRSWDRAYELHINPRRWEGDARDWPLKLRWRAYLAVRNIPARLRGIIKETR